MSDGRYPNVRRPFDQLAVVLFPFVLYTFNAHESFNVPTTDYFH